MALPSNNPTTTSPPTTTTTTASSVAPSPRPYLQHPRPHQPQPHPLYNRQHPHPNTLTRPANYPVAGFNRPRAHPVQGYQQQVNRQHPVGGVRAFGYGSVQMNRAVNLQNVTAGNVGGGVMRPATGNVLTAPPSSVTAYPKAVPTPAPANDANGYKEQRDRSDDYVMVRDRKVKVSSSTSLYAACRSWLRNGQSEETQAHYPDGIKLLPKPSPPPVPDAHSPAEQEEPKKEEEEEEEEPVENLSASDLLKRHVKRAKKVRARLSEERLHRIARYKTRLALLLPPLVEQHQFKFEANEAGGGN